MKNISTAVAFILVLGWGQLALASASHQGSTDNRMKHDVVTDTYNHQSVVEGVRAEFQVMNLTAMNVKDPEGNTHHIMVKFFNPNSHSQIKDAIGKIKVISPSGLEQIAALKNYNGIFAANFTFKEEGKYGVICLFKINGQKRLVKFWYPHG